MFRKAFIFFKLFQSIKFIQMVLLIGLIFTLSFCEAKDESSCQLNPEKQMYHGQIQYYSALPDNNNPSLVYYAKCFHEIITCYSEDISIADSPPNQIPCPSPDFILKEEAKSLGVYLPNKSNLWPKGVLCHDLGSSRSNFTTKQIEVIKNAMNHIKKRTNIRFIYLESCKEKFLSTSPWICNECKNYVHFRRANGFECSAQVGYLQQGEQYVNLSPRCFLPKNNGSEEGVIIHEISHALGVKHEHQHIQRKVVVLVKELTVSLSNYIRLTNMNSTPYDLNSIMHYDTGSLCFPKPFCSSIKANDSNCLVDEVQFCDANEFPEQHNCTYATRDVCDQSITFGQREGLSVGDITNFAKMYPDSPFRFN